MNKWLIILSIFLGFLIRVTNNSIAHIDNIDSQFSNYNFTFNSKTLSDPNNNSSEAGDPDSSHYYYNYDRFRSDIDFTWGDKLTFKIIFDMENYLGSSYINTDEFKSIKDVSCDMPFNPYHNIIDENNHLLRSYLYRSYASFYWPKSTLTFGLQRLSLGIGHIWSPIDIINPLNPLSVEKVERLGVCGADYTYNLSNLTQLKTFFTLKDNWNFKDYGIRLKGNYKTWDIGVSIVDGSEMKLLGLEVERELLETGIEVIMELSYNDSNILNKKYQKHMVGFAYGFPNSTYIVLEYLFNGAGNTNKTKYDFDSLNQIDWNQLAKNYIGTNITYNLTPIVTLSAGSIINIDDKSLSLAPSVLWNIFQNVDINLGASFYYGTEDSEFDFYENLYYFQISNYF